jgi:hypothetical protein
MKLRLLVDPSAILVPQVPADHAGDKSKHLPHGRRVLLSIWVHFAILEFALRFVSVRLNHR